MFFGLAVSLVASGCSGGGGGLSGLFESGFGGVGSGDLLASFEGGSNGEIFGAGGEGGGVGDSGGLLPSGVATVHNPEPASATLFGAGLAGLAALTRRRAKPRKRSRQ